MAIRFKNLEVISNFKIISRIFSCYIPLWQRLSCSILIVALRLGYIPPLMPLKDYTLVISSILIFAFLIHLFHRYLMSSYCISQSLFSLWDTALNKECAQSLLSWSLLSMAKFTHLLLIHIPLCSCSFNRESSFSHVGQLCVILLSNHNKRMWIFIAYYAIL